MDMQWQSALQWLVSFFLHAACACVIVPASLWNRPQARSAAELIASL